MTASYESRVIQGPRLGPAWLEAVESFPRCLEPLAPDTEHDRPRGSHTVYNVAFHCSNQMSAACRKS
jgi:hypothetical protein